MKVTLLRVRRSLASALLYRREAEPNPDRAAWGDNQDVVRQHRRRHAA